MHVQLMTVGAIRLGVTRATCVVAFGFHQAPVPFGELRRVGHRMNMTIVTEGLGVTTEAIGIR